MSEWMNNSKLNLNYYSVFFKNTWGLECLFQYFRTSSIFFFLIQYESTLWSKIFFSADLFRIFLWAISSPSGLISYRDKLWIRLLRVCYCSLDFILVRNLTPQKYYIFSLPKTCAFVISFFIPLVSKPSITHCAS